MDQEKLIKIIKCLKDEVTEKAKTTNDETILFEIIGMQNAYFNCLKLLEFEDTYNYALKKFNIE